MSDILVVGDVIIDEYTHGTPIGLSAETPTMVARQERVETFVGGAGLVCRHLLRLGHTVHLATVTGPLESIWSLMETSSDPPTEEEFERFRVLSYSDIDWRLTRKRRFYMKDYKVAQYDILNDGKLNATLTYSFVNGLWQTIEGWDYQAMVICDNRHGVGTLAADLVQKMRGWYRRPLKIYVDSQISQTRKSNLDEYVGADYFLVNERELDAVLDMNFGVEEMPIENKIRRAQLLLGGKVVVKLGEQGSVTLEDDKLEFQSYEKIVAVDTCGAGDAFMAAYVATGDLVKANQWAGLSTTYKGTIVPKESL